MICCDSGLSLGMTSFYFVLKEALVYMYWRFSQFMPLLLRKNMCRAGRDFVISNNCSVRRKLRETWAYDKAAIEATNTD